MKRVLFVLLSALLASLAPLSHAQEPGEHILYEQDFSAETPGGQNPFYFI